MLAPLFGGVFDKAGHPLCHRIRAVFAFEEIDKADLGQNQIGKGRMIDQIKLIRRVLLFDLGLIGLRGGFDLIFTAGQADHFGVQVGRKIAHHFGRIARGID